LAWPPFALGDPRSARRWPLYTIGQYALTYCVYGPSGVPGERRRAGFSEGHRRARLPEALSGDMLRGMEIHYRQELAIPARRVEAILIRTPETLILKLARQAGRRGEQLLSEVGFGGLGRGCERTS
jgi:hypothetical protein